MTAKLAWAGFSFLSGLWLFCLDMGKSAAALLAADAVLCLVSAVFIKRIRAYVLTVGAFAAAGLLCAGAYAHFNYEKVIAYSGQTVAVRGAVTDFYYNGDDSYTIEVKGRINGGVTSKISFYTDNFIPSYYQEVEVVGLVEKITDSPDYPAAEIGLTDGTFIRGRGAAEVTDLNGCKNPLMRAAMRLRDRVRRNILDYTDKNTGGFLVALVCGDKTKLSQSLKTQLYRSGIGHMFAVSGLHLSVLAAFAELFTGKLPRRLRLVVMSALILAFMGFSGFSLSVVRAGIMLILSYAAAAVGRKTACLNSLGACILITGVANPFAAISPSFLLSFSAAFAVGFICPRLRELSEDMKFSSLIDQAVSPLAIMFVVMPFCALFFDSVSVISPLTNTIVSPFCSSALLFALPGALVGSFGGFFSEFLLRICAALADIAIKISCAFAELPFAVIPGRYCFAAAIVPIFVWIGIFFAIRSRRLKMFLITAVSALIGLYLGIALVRTSERDKTYIFLLPGDDASCTAVVCRGGQAIIIDEGDCGDSVYRLQKLISRRGIDRINCVYISENFYFTRAVTDNGIYPKPQEYQPLPQEGEPIPGYDYCMERDGGVAIETDGAEFLIKDGCLYTPDGKAAQLTEYPAVIIVKDREYEVRSTDYAFNER